ncbi:hypothetical protein NC651_019235 [Populus alba x Populus x berolinensis]|nr:hypothetical protein NC651_019235 [Populus alba x Populus x berolinensis]
MPGLQGNTVADFIAASKATSADSASLALAEADPLHDRLCLAGLITTGAIEWISTQYTAVQNNHR